MDEAGSRLTSRRLPEGLEGIRGFHDLVAGVVDEPGEVVVGIETDLGLWVEALVAAGIRCMGSIRWRCRVTGTGTIWRVLSLMPVTPKCWQIWSVPTGITIDPSLVTAT